MKLHKEFPKIESNINSPFYISLRVPPNCAVEVQGLLGIEFFRLNTKVENIKRYRKN